MKVKCSTSNDISVPLDSSQKEHLPILIFFIFINIVSSTQEKSQFLLFVDSLKLLWHISSMNVCLTLQN